MTKPWKLHRQDITQLYIKEGRTLHDVRKIMKDRYGFDASIRAYRQHFDKWNVGKYNCKKRKNRRGMNWSVGSVSPVMEPGLLAEEEARLSASPEHQSFLHFVAMSQQQQQQQQQQQNFPRGPRSQRGSISSISSSLSSLSSISSPSSSSDRDTEHESIADSCSCTGRSSSSGGSSSGGSSSGGSSSGHGSPQPGYHRQPEYEYTTSAPSPQPQQARLHHHQELITEHHWTKFISPAGNIVLPEGTPSAFPYTHPIPRYRDADYTYFSTPRYYEPACFDMSEGNWTSAPRKPVKVAGLLSYPHPGSYSVPQQDEGMTPVQC